MYQHIENILALTQKAFANSPARAQAIGKTNAKGEQSIGMDDFLESQVFDYLDHHGVPVKVFSEESGWRSFGAGKYLLTLDPLDGSINYEHGSMRLPFGLLVAIYQGIEPTLGQVIAAGAAEFTTGDQWVFSGGKTVDQNGRRVELTKDWGEEKSIPVYLDLYYPQAWNKFQKVGERFFVRGTGSTIGNLQMVLNENAAAMGSVCMRPEEIGTVHALITGAKGLALSNNGHLLSSTKHSSEKTYFIVAGQSATVRKIQTKV